MPAHTDSRYQILCWGSMSPGVKLDRGLAGRIEVEAFLVAEEVSMVARSEASPAVAF